MMSWKSISTKLYALLAVAVILSGLLAWTALDRLDRVQARVGELTTTLYGELRDIQDLHRELLELTLARDRLEAATAASQRDALRAEINSLAHTIEITLEEISERDARWSDPAGVRDALGRLNTYVEALSDADAEAAPPSPQPMIAAVESLRTDVLNRVGVQLSGTSELLENARAPIVFGSVLMIIFLAVFAAYMVRSHVVRPISELRDVIGEIAHDLDFTRRYRYFREDEVGAAAVAFNTLMEQIQNALRELSHNTSQVAGGAAQASNAVGQVAEGAQTQINDLNQIADAMQQTSLSITDAAHTTREASEQATAAARLVEAGQERMATMLQAARGISEDSKRINRFTDAITRIATETHMLSLNASIEAARAGEHGKGFAVVAQQVGKLAEDAAESAQEILALARQADADATRSVDAAEQLGRTMEEISERVTESDGMVRSVATAVEEQRAAVDRIGVNVGSLREIGQGNATAAEEITATMIELSKLAQRSREQVDRFRTD